MLLNELVLISSIQQKNHFKMSADFNFAKAFQGYLCTGTNGIGACWKICQAKLNRAGLVESASEAELSVRIASVQLFAFVERGECQVGIVYRTDALMSKKVKISGAFPARTHRPIVYPIALTRQGQKNQAAVQFSKIYPDESKGQADFPEIWF